jgi:uncharacterized membrane protein
LRNLLQMRSQIPKNLLLPYIALGVGTFALSFAAMYVRWAQAPGVVTGFYRLFLSSLVLLPFLVVKRNTTKAEARWMDMLPPILSGMCMAVNFALWNTSLAYTTVANASVLGSITPIWVSLVAWTLFRERLNHRFWMGLLTMFAGIILITSSSSLLHPHLGVGDMLAAVASIFFCRLYTHYSIGPPAPQCTYLRVDQRRQRQCMDFADRTNCPLSSYWLSLADLGHFCLRGHNHPARWLHSDFIFTRQVACLGCVTDVEPAACAYHSSRNSITG